jgi:predicted signal transduction protein with EAL and GGDEF domain
MNGMVARVKHLFEAQAGQLMVLRQQVHQDALTGVSTRKHFFAELGSALERDEGPLAAGLLLLRLRDLGGLNSRRGHAEVDQLLQALAEALKAYPERVPGCLIGRLNGSDFALWLPAEGVAAEAGEALAGVLRASLPAFGEGVQVAMGVVELSRDCPVGVWMGEADAALARAETQGHGLVELVSVLAVVGAVQGEAVWRQQLLEALARRRGRLAEFPVADARGQVLHWECPLQLRLDPEGDWLSAARWLPLAQRIRLTTEIDLFAVALALEASGRDGRPRCINLAPASLLDPAFLPSLRGQFGGAPQAARLLLLDLPEVAAVQNFELLVEAGRQLRPLGVQVGLEHAGAGLARIDRLYQAGRDYVKLDASVVRGVAGDAARVAFVRGTVIMLRSLTLKVYGEGVVEGLDAQALWDCELDGLTGPWVTSSTASA